MMIKAGLVVLAAVAIVGCGSEDDGTPVSAAGTPSVGKDGVSRASAPPGSIPQGGIALEPKDPNNPIYKQDPRLSGGG